MKLPILADLGATGGAIFATSLRVFGRWVTLPREAFIRGATIDVMAFLAAFDVMAFLAALPIGCPAGPSLFSRSPAPMEAAVMATDSTASLTLVDLDFWLGI